MIGIETAGLLVMSGIYASLVLSQISGARERRAQSDPAEGTPQPARRAGVSGAHADPTATERRMQVEQARWRLLC